MPWAREPVFTLSPLDKHFVPPKPRPNISMEKLLALERAGNLLITRKRDGYCMLIVVSDGDAKIYTRGIEDTTARYPHIVKDLRRIRWSDLFLLTVEMLFDREGNDDYEMLAKIANSSPEEALHLQKKFGFTKCMLHNVIIFQYRDVAGEPNSVRYDMLSQIYQRLFISGSRYILPLEKFDFSLAMAKELVRQRKWEGLVLYDKAKPTDYRLDGRSDLPPRPDGCWKWKPLTEGDFLVETWEAGKNRNKNRVGKLQLLQIDSQTGEKINCGSVGAFSDKMREFLAVATYPLVVEVAYEKTLPSGKIKNPRFLRIREDKKPEECIMP